MYYHLKIVGVPNRISDDEAQQFMEQPHIQWRKEKTKFGTLYVGEYDWAGFTKDGDWITRPPCLKDGGKVPKNQVVWDMFFLLVYGDCILNALPDKTSELMTARLKLDRRLG